jgi:hypothetical protein
MVLDVKEFVWEEIPGKISLKPGIYAWYCSVEIPKPDLDDCISKLDSKTPGLPEDEKVNLVEGILQKFIFGRFDPPLYDVSLSGQLMPNYEGKIEYKSKFDRNRLRNIAQDPKRLRQLNEAFKHSSPDFVPPIYIGMTVNLRRRANEHKELIRSMRESSNGVSSDLSPEDQNFASEVVRRGMRTLLLKTMEIPLDRQFVGDAEYFLNRLVYPIAGRL